MDDTSPDKQESLEEDEATHSSMSLEPDERDLALEIKKVVEEQSDGLPQLSDFMYAQHAIASQGCLATALDRIRGLQYFYEEYGIDESVDQGVHAVHQYLELHPTGLLHVDYHDEGDSVAIVHDLGKVFPNKVFRLDKEGLTDRHWKIHVMGSFYSTHALNPNLECIRNGHITLIEGSSFGWDNFSTKCERRLQEEYMLFYPLNPQKVLFYNTNVVINTLVGILKPVLPRHVQDAFEVGCQIEGQEITLRDLFLQPTPEIAQANLLRNIQKLLQERAKNERSFRL